MHPWMRCGANRGFGRHRGGRGRSAQLGRQRSHDHSALTTAAGPLWPWLIQQLLFLGDQEAPEEALQDCIGAAENHMGRDNKVPEYLWAGFVTYRPDIPEAVRSQLEQLVPSGGIRMGDLLLAVRHDVAKLACQLRR